MEEHENTSRLSSSENSDESYGSRSAETKCLQMKHKSITLHIAAWKHFGHVVGLWNEEVLKDICDNIATDSSNTEETKQSASELMPMADRVRKLADSELKEAVNRSICRLVSEIDEYAIQYDLYEKLILEESLSLEDTPSARVAAISELPAHWYFFTSYK